MKLKLSIITILLLCMIATHSQTISAGIGKTSQGSCTALFLVHGEKRGFYYKAIYDNNPPQVNSNMVFNERHENTIGYSWKVAERVYLLAGFGWNRSVDKNISVKGQSIECGFGYDVISHKRLNVSIVSIFSAYSYLSTILVVGYRFR